MLGIHPDACSRLGRFGLRYVARAPPQYHSGPSGRIGRPRMVPAWFPDTRTAISREAPVPGFPFLFVSSPYHFLILLERAPAASHFPHPNHFLFRPMPHFACFFFRTPGARQQRTSTPSNIACRLRSTVWVQPTPFAHRLFPCLGAPRAKGGMISLDKHHHCMCRRTTNSSPSAIDGHQWRVPSRQSRSTGPACVSTTTHAPPGRPPFLFQKLVYCWLRHPGRHT